MKQSSTKLLHILPHSKHKKLITAALAGGTRYCDQIICRKGADTSDAPTALPDSLGADDATFYNAITWQTTYYIHVPMSLTETTA